MKRATAIILSSLMAILLIAGRSFAQYVPIPQFVGTNAGRQFRDALNAKLSGATTIAPQLVHLSFYQLPATVTNGKFYYIDDGAPGGVCTGGGSGALAIGMNGKWACLSGPTTNLSGYGASGSGSQLSCTATSGSVVLTNCAPATATDPFAGGNPTVPIGSNDFQTGQNVMVRGGGASNTIATPSTPTVSATCGAGGCSNSYTYQCQARGADGQMSAVSATSTPVSNGTIVPGNMNAQLYYLDYNHLTDNLPTGAQYLICQQSTNSGTTWGVQFRVDDPVGFGYYDTSNNNASPDLSTYGTPFWDYAVPNAPPTTTTPALVGPVAATLYTAIAAGGGTPTLTLSAPSQQTGTVRVLHDDTAALQAAFAAINPGVITCNGVYNVAGTLQVSRYTSIVGASPGSCVIQQWKGTGPLLERIHAGIIQPGSEGENGGALSNIVLWGNYIGTKGLQFDAVPAVNTNNIAVGGFVGAGTAGTSTDGYQEELIGTQNITEHGLVLFDGSNGIECLQDSGTLLNAANISFTGLTQLYNLAGYYVNLLGGTSANATIGCDYWNFQDFQFEAVPTAPTSTAMLNFDQASTNYFGAGRMGQNPVVSGLQSALIKTTANTTNLTFQNTTLGAALPAQTQLINNAAQNVNFNNINCGGRYGVCWGGYQTLLTNNSPGSIAIFNPNFPQGGLVMAGTATSNVAWFVANPALNGSISFNLPITPGHSTYANLPVYSGTISSFSPSMYITMAGAGPTQADSSGNGNTATNHNTTTALSPSLVVDGASMSELLGSTGYFTVPTSGTMISNDGPWTMGAIVKLAVVTGAGQDILSQGTGGAELIIGPASLALNKVGTGTIMVSGYTITDTKSHLVGVDKNGNNVHLYLDGVDVSNSALTNAYTIAPSNGALTIGASSIPSEYLQGYISDVFQIPTVLPAAAWRDLYEQMISAKNGSLMFVTDLGCNAMYNFGWRMTFCGVHPVASLPDCTKALGARATISDNNAACGSTGFWVVPTGGGSATCQVACDGSNATTGWKID